MSNANPSIAIVGYGKIAADSHVPAIRANAAFELVAVVSARGAHDRRDPKEPQLTNRPTTLHHRWPS